MKNNVIYTCITCGTQLITAHITEDVLYKRYGFSIIHQCADHDSHIDDLVFCSKKCLPKTIDEIKGIVAERNKAGDDKIICKRLKDSKGERK